MTFAYEMITCIVNAGFSDVVMETAKKFGARGGTVVRAKGTADTDAESRFQITIQPEKEIVLIVVPTALKNDILHALYKDVGLETPGQGIAFALPVDGAVGLSEPEKQE